MKLLEPTRARALGLEPIPGDPGPPLLRRNWEMFKGTATNDLADYDRFGPISWGEALGVRYVKATGPDAAAQILQNKDKAFANGPAWEHFIGPFFHRGLMLMDFEEHHANRRIMQEAFTRPRLAGYLDSMSPLIADRVGSWGGQSEFRFFPAVTALGLDVATHSFIGERPGPRMDEIMHAFHDCTQAALAVVRRPAPLTTWRRGVRGRALLEEYFAPLVAQARQREGDDLLSVLCHVEDEHGLGFSDQDVLDHMIFLLMAAHDTSVSAMTSMAFFLAKHPEWQERCRAESEALGDRSLAYADTDALPSLGLVLKEAMRLVSPLPAMARRAIKDTELQGFFVPKGTMVQLTVQLNHWLPEVWTDPRRFDPERFAEPRREDKAARMAYLPFGGGVHKCIGLYFAQMEMLSVLHRMLLGYRWSVPEGYEMPLSYKALPYPTDGLPIRLESIDRARVPG
jgi:cytochrome P450